jgi:spore protease
VGNHREALTKESLGVPVIAMGIPMVVDAGTIVSDAMSKMPRNYDDNILNCMDTQLQNMYVTPKNIDETTKRLSFTLSEAINMALDLEQEDLSCE